MTVLVTGASGFIGRQVVNEFSRRSIAMRVIQRSGHRFISYGEGAEIFAPSGLTMGVTDLARAMEGCASVIHLAGLAQIMPGSPAHQLAELRRVNVDLTTKLAQQAVQLGVKRFVFVSSIKVNGNVTSHAKPFSAESCPAPHCLYAQSKFEAEQKLYQISQDTGLEVVVIRPPLVYGFGVSGNFRIMINAIRRGLPLPLSMSQNRRSFVAVDNLVDLLRICLTHPAAANQTFVVSDGEDLSTTDLLRRLGVAMNKEVRLLPVPIGLLAMGAKLLRRSELFQSVCCSLEVDMKKTQELLDWYPPISVDEGLKRAVQE